ncbi:hypothetical protein FPQ18DRAFT_53083 [Pyronema domesticum]|nr:hypothetical protein FPQ18DRAFT_53083 [Pyronema domesticum]
MGRVGRVGSIGSIGSIGEVLEAVGMEAGKAGSWNGSTGRSTLTVETVCISEGVSEKHNRRPVYVHCIETPNLRNETRIEFNQARGMMMFFSPETVSVGDPGTPTARGMQRARATVKGFEFRTCGAMQVSSDSRECSGRVELDGTKVWRKVYGVGQERGMGGGLWGSIDDPPACQQSASRNEWPASRLLGSTGTLVIGSKGVRKGREGAREGGREGGSVVRLSDLSWQAKTGEGEVGGGVGGSLGGSGVTWVGEMGVRRREVSLLFDLFVMSPFGFLLGAGFCLLFVVSRCLCSFFQGFRSDL